jgi:branched-chain amino acid transport system permease protein
METLRKELRSSLLAAAWFALLAFPIVVIRVNTVEKTISWRWHNLAWTAGGAFACSWLWRWWLGRRAGGAAPGPAAAPGAAARPRAAPARAAAALRERPAWRRGALAGCALAALVFPWTVSSYPVTVLVSALIAVILGLGLHIVVGQAGLLNLGHAAFYAVGAYSYALLNLHAGLGFWACLPIGGLLAAAAGVLLGFPVLRLRGDYLAIVTLGFGEIVRLVLENWTALANGPSGIAGIPRPGIPGVALGPAASTIHLYYITLAVVRRLKDSRVGRAWTALREDETAAQAMGIDRTRTMLAAFALGAFFAGVAGVLFAAKTSFVNPSSFTFLESAMVLAIVVLGGSGSVAGVVVAALTLTLLPEYLQAFSSYRMLIFGAALVLMMIVRPQGLAPRARRRPDRGGEPARGR